MAQFVQATPTAQVGATVSIQHWQLRDLVHCPTSGNEALFVGGPHIHRTLFDEGSSDVVIRDLGMLPASFTTGLGFMAAGGQSGQLVVKDALQDGFTALNVGGSINNGLHIGRPVGATSPRLLVCNNDATIKVLALPSLERVTDLVLPAPVNYASMSPDGRHVVAVGDTKDVTVFDVRGNDFTIAQQYKGVGDAAFACAWSPCSTMYAIAAQDGILSVWDVRSHRQLVKVSSKLAGLSPGAVRAIKFAPAPLDLLVFSEHAGHVDVLDTRTFNSRQVIRVRDTTHGDAERQHISGIAFSPDGAALVVGTETTMFKYAVDVQSRRLFGHGELR